MSKKQADEDEDGTHAWVETHNPFPADVALRARGWQIHSRRKDEEPEWQRGGKVLSQSEAVDVLD